MKALYDHALAVATQLTILGEDDRVRLRAAQWIAAEAEKSGKLAEEARKLRNEDLAKLRDILGAPAAEYESQAKRAAEFLSEVRKEPPVEQKVANPPAPEIQYIEKCVSPPGHFPPRFVKVPVRNPAGPEGARKGPGVPRRETDSR
jgi:hypothetical protein